MGVVTNARLPLRAIVATVACCVGSSVEAGTNRNTLNIEAGDAAHTLKEFSEQTGIQTFPSPLNILEGVNTQPYRGKPDAKVALRRMLEGTGLNFVSFDSHTIKIVRSERVSKNNNPDPPEVVVVAPSDWSPSRGPSMTKEDLQRSGVSSIGDFMRTFVWNSGGGCYDDLTSVTREDRTNSTLACGWNLHGAGPGATLILINGRRVAYGGTAALFGDVSHIPISAIERIEITKDSAYAIYASDAIAGVVNFVLKQGYEGIETQASWAPSSGGRVGERRFSQIVGTTRSGWNGSALIEYYDRDGLPASDRKGGTSNLTPWRGSNYGTLFGTPANIAIGSRIWASPYSTEGQPVLFDTRESTDLLPSQRRVGGRLAGSFDVSPDFKVSGDALITWRGVLDTSSAQADTLTINPDNPFYFNPTGGSEPVTVYYGFLHPLGPATLENHVWNGDFDLSLDARIDTGWKIKNSTGYSFENQHETLSGGYDPYKVDSLVATGVFDPFGNNSESVLRSIRSQSEFSSTSVLAHNTIFARGPLTISPVGDVDVIAGLDYRFEEFSSRELAGSYASTVQATAHRSVISAFGQICIPVTWMGDSVCEDGEKTAARGSQLSLGGRYEYTKEFGRHVTPAVQVTLSPVSFLSFKANWSRPSKIPALPDLIGGDNRGQIVTFPVPSSKSPSSSALLLSGGYPNLRREAAETWTLGATLKSNIGGGLDLSFQYYSLNDRDRVDQPLIGADVLTSPLTSYLVTHNPTPEQLAAACKGIVFSGAASDCAHSGADDIIDARLRNTTKLVTDGFDVSLKQTVNNRFLSSLGISSTYILKYVLSDSSGTADRVSSPGYPDQFRAAGFARLDRRTYDFEVAVQYANGYHDFVDVPNRDVRSFTTVDVHFKKRFGVKIEGQACGFELSVDVQNAFNRPPPFVNMSVGLGFDTTNAGILGREVKMGVRKCW